MLWNMSPVFSSKSELELSVLSLVSSANDELKEGSPFSHSSPLLLFVKNVFIFWHLLASFFNFFSFSNLRFAA